MNASSPFDDISTVPEAARLVGYSASHLYNLLAWGKIEGRKFGRTVIVYLPSVYEYRRKLNRRTS